MVPSIETYTAGNPRSMPVAITTGLTQYKPNQEELQTDCDMSNYSSRTELEKPRSFASIREVISQKNDEKPSRAYAELIVRKKTTEMFALLVKLNSNLETPEGARYMTTFRNILSVLWGLKDSLSKEKVVLISAVEEVIRGKKWRELTAVQIETLKNTVHQVGGIVNSKALSESLRTIHRSGMDIFPDFEIDDDFDAQAEDDDD